MVGSRKGKLGERFGLGDTSAEIICDHENFVKNKDRLDKNKKCGGQLHLIHSDIYFHVCSNVPVYH